MAAFTPAQLDYLGEQRLGRLATAGANGRPHVVPVAFTYNAELDTIADARAIRQIRNDNLTLVPMHSLLAVKKGGE